MAQKRQQHHMIRPHVTDLRRGPWQGDFETDLLHSFKWPRGRSLWRRRHKRWRSCWKMKVGRLHRRTPDRAFRRWKTPDRANWRGSPERIPSRVFCTLQITRPGEMGKGVGVQREHPTGCSVPGDSPDRVIILRPSFCGPFLGIWA